VLRKHRRQLRRNLPLHLDVTFNSLKYVVDTGIQDFNFPMEPPIFAQAGGPVEDHSYVAPTCGCGNVRLFTGKDFDPHLACVEESSAAT
jgi:hypothetical protein